MPVDFEVSRDAAPAQETSSQAPVTVVRSSRVDWTTILPFRNEKEAISETLQSLAAQQMPTYLILVDNGSTDRTGQFAAAECERLGLDYTMVLEPRPGKVRALATGLSQVTTMFVATCDADTFYPPHYLSAATTLLRDPKTVCAQAYYPRTVSDGWSRLYRGAKLLAFTWLLPHQAHNGGAGQVFRTNALRRAGGFDPEIWNLALEDHEIINRVAKLGTVKCSWAFWCVPGRRHNDRPSLRWNLVERVAYHFTPARFSDWYFYDYLRPRLKQRSGSRLGEQD